ncbi:MAG: hypothetical protein EKK47_13435 [Burkholderiales bacterium]|jgi:hypothetical protein|nr:MAG: hypothetical protein EKK47_13435 [Burkholderiales bacterium]
MAKPILSVWGLAAVLSLCGVLTAARAQNLYRCGSTYQDHPCNGVDGKVVGRNVQGAGQGAAAAASLDPACQMRGSAAQKMMWERESGRTLDEQLGKPGVDADLARNVYGRRGSSLDVRKAIEADCVKEMERANDAAALLRAASKAQPAGAVPGATQTPVSVAGAGAAVASSSTDDVARRAAAQKAATCSDLATDLSALNQAQRTGGDAAQMDVLAARVRDVQSRKRAAGC